MLEPTVFELDPQSGFKNYQAQALSRCGASDVHLLVLPNRKRLQPIVVEVETALLQQLLKARNSTNGATSTSVQEIRERQTDRIRELESMVRVYGDKWKDAAQRLASQAKTIAELELRLNEGEDLRLDLYQKLDDLKATCTDLDNELVYVKGCLASERDKAVSLKQRCELLRGAIRKVLYPTDRGATWKTAHTAFRNGLARRGFHPRSHHPFWSLAFWFGCPTCVPEWFLYSAEELTNDQTCLTRDVVAALDQEIEAILQPALSGSEPTPKTQDF